MYGRKEGRETMEPCSFHLVPHFLKEYAHHKKLGKLKNNLIYAKLEKVLRYLMLLVHLILLVQLWFYNFYNYLTSFLLFNKL